jgi:hypothetical protein
MVQNQRHLEQEYAVQTNEPLILEGLANLAMKQGETTNELISQITKTIVIIKESYPDYREKVQIPPNKINHGVSSVIFSKFATDHMMNFFKMNLFWAVLTPDLRGVITQQEQENMTIKKMYRIAITVQKESKETRKLAAFS